MTAPFAPELVSPKNKGASAAASVTLTWKFRSVVAGDGMVTYAIRRRAMTPTVGAYEYWTGAAWGAETFIAGPVAPNLVQDGMTFSTTIVTGWTTDKVYQWSVKVRNAAAEASPYADDNLIQIHAAPSMAITVSSAVISRPSLAWVWAGAAGYFQKTYRLALYTAAVRNAVGFDASSPAWQALATWIMPADKYSANDWKVAIDADLSNGVQYYIWYKTTDNADLSSGWIESGNFTPAFTAVPPPTLVATPDAVNGTVSVVVRSSFNLLVDEASIFNTGISNWVGSLNCQTDWNSALQKLILTCGGMSYAALDAAYGTFANEDAAYATFAAEKAAQAAPAGTARALSGDQAGERVIVAPGIAYSAIATLNNHAATNRTAKLGIRWYKADNSASALTVISQGAGVVLTPGVDTAVNVLNVASPADAAFAAIEIEWTVAAVGDIIYADDVAIASTSSISWSPAGNAFDISFVLERSVDGINWTPVWGASKTAPHASDTGAVSQVVLLDRIAPLGTALIYYRAYAISKFSSNPTWSALASINIPGINPMKWWLRRTSVVGRDVRIMAGSFSGDTNLHHEVIEPEGRTNPMVGKSAAPKTDTLSISLMSLDKATFDLTMEALKADETLYLQTNLDGNGFYLCPVESLKREQRRATAPAGSAGNMRNLYSISFSAVVVDATL